ncbi:3D domain-containing protein [Clostridium sp. OS1-26]|uniref:3D domain-containing protein n=1 Tax=Clostridium sp. OS1-26 TaxID=3070681 RepID=UPI0027DECD8C|nr:3D domain-containing protein [Clostridium sp. OS1-26]WML36516.1 ubiquitin-like domain-containing protein [Clostridium sp. OS1-26]
MVEKLKDYFKKHLSSGSKAISAVMLVLAILTVVICSMRKTIIVSIDGKEQKITTLSSTYKSALSNNNITVGPKDKAIPSLDSKVENGAKLSVRKALNVQVNVNGTQLTVQSAEDSVEKMLEKEGIGLKEFDKVSPSKDTALKDGLKVDVVRVSVKEVKEVKSIDYATVVKKDEDMDQGAKKTLQEGQPGEKETVSKIVYENGKEISRKVVSETIKKQPVQKVVAMGTLSVYTPSRGGQIIYKDSIRMRATAYTSSYADTGKGPGSEGFGITATGTVAKRNSNSYSSVAVDPRVIPLGTKLYVEGYGYAVAEDTGGAIKGNRIDVYFNSSSEADNWGVKWVNVYVIK